MSIGNGGGDSRLARISGFDVAAEMRVELGQPIVVEVIDGHIGTLPDGNLRRIEGGNAAAEDGDAAWSDAGHAAQQDSAPALRLFEIMGTDLDRHTARDF